MTEPRQIAVVRSYDELLAALRKRADDLNVSRLVFDDISGLQGGYAAKLLAPVPIRGLGRTSMGLLLSAMGLALVVIEDADMLARINKRHTPRRAQFARHAGEAMPAKINKKKWGFRGSEAGRLLRARQILLATDSERRRSARTAAKARWRKVKAARKAARGAGTARAASPPDAEPSLSRPRISAPAARTRRARGPLPSMPV